MSELRVALAQMNPVVGDLAGNVERIVAAMGEAESAGCDLVALPELAVTGYPPEDLLLRQGFVRDNLEAVARVAERSGSCVAVVGFVDVDDIDAWSSEGHDIEARPAGLYNAVAVCAEGRVLGTYRKRRLPNYSVFDEQRYFVPGREPLRLFRVAGVDVGVSICEDAWVADGPVAELARGGAGIVVNVNASPYHAGKRDGRARTLAARTLESGVPLVYVNQVGGQDELVFDGDSMVVDAGGTVSARMPQFREGLAVVDVAVAARRSTEPLAVVEGPSARPGERPSSAPPGVAPPLGEEAEVWEALVLGTRDFVRKNGFTDVVVGLSGGVDSALVATIAVDALGPDHVHGVLMPSRYSSEHSVDDARQLAENLGIEHRTVPIEAAHTALMGMLEPAFTGHPLGLTEENLQSRVRAVVLMALSNAFGWLLLNTGNKSEAAVGYSTLYGDSAGGFAVIKDVSKLLVYRLCEHRNEVAGTDRIPRHTLVKPPSAELRPDQRDDQSLPPYEVLDPILADYVERDRSLADIVADGADPALAERVARLVDRAEFKRRQSPPGPRVTTKGFGKDRRLPITNRYEA
ncbi:NAD+ synthase [Rhabdothermincola salaria]|uniref:NAD+ synthase n=1 Tax=Rhabdothermincola salaria TaxID=2903142 RepID=UPI001E3FF1F4|nr:NAD+ synthase [Rhabdothermincola salaria]MCD9624616.1 NAD+ synthase [Rhabdothermincola salaria]